jgi:HEAT repeat protein
MLTAVTNLQGVHHRWELIRQFGILESNGAPAIPALIAWAHDKDEWVREGAVSALGEIGQQPEAVVPVLRSVALTDPQWLERRDAAEALGSFGPEVIPDLIKSSQRSGVERSDWRFGRAGKVGRGETGGYFAFA